MSSRCWFGIPSMPTWQTRWVVRELGVREHFWKCALTKPNSITTFHLMVIILLKSICILFYSNHFIESIYFSILLNLYIFPFYWNLYVFILCGIYMFLFHMETNAFSIAWLHTTGSLKFSENRKFFSENRKSMMSCFHHSRVQLHFPARDGMFVST